VQYLNIIPIKEFSMKSLTLVLGLAIVLCGFSGSLAAQNFENSVQSERPSLPEVWRTALEVGGKTQIAEGRDGEHVLAWGERSLASYNSHTGAREWELNPGYYIGNLVMFSTKDLYLMFGGSGQNDITLIQTRRYPTSEVIRTIIEPLAGAPVTVSDNEKYFAATGAPVNSIIVWDVETGQKVWTLPGGDYYQFASCWTRDSTRLIVTKHLNSATREVSCWDIENNRLVWTRTIGGLELSTGLRSKDGRRMIYHYRDYEVREFPSLQLVYSTTTIRPLNIISSQDAWHLLINYGSLVVQTVADGSIREIDSVSGGIAQSSQQGFIYRWGYNFLQKLRFDWAVSVPDPTPPVIRAFFPNPCVGSGVLEYDVKGSHVVDLSLHTVTGELVRQLVLAQQSGPQRVPVDCGSLAAGTYYCVLVIGKEKFTQVVQVGGQGGVK
jgi:hypothetical protein